MCGSDLSTPDSDLGHRCRRPCHAARGYLAGIGVGNSPAGKGQRRRMYNVDDWRRRAWYGVVRVDGVIYHNEHARPGRHHVPNVAWPAENRRNAMPDTSRRCIVMPTYTMCRLWELYHYHILCGHRLCAA